MTPLERDNIIRGLSAEEGFAEYGAAEICIMEAERAFLEESVSNGYNADMQYLAKNIQSGRILLYFLMEQNLFYAF